MEWLILQNAIAMATALAIIILLLKAWTRLRRKK